MFSPHRLRDFLPLILTIVLAVAITCGKLFLPSSPGHSVHDYDTGYSDGWDEGYEEGYQDALRSVEDQLNEYFTDGYYEGYSDALSGVDERY